MKYGRWGWSKEQLHASGLYILGCLSLETPIKFDLSREIKIIEELATVQQPVTPYDATPNYYQELHRRRFTASNDYAKPG